MKKLKLDVEELAVEQFKTEAAEDEGQGEGTVQAYESKWWSGCNVSTCYC